MRDQNAGLGSECSRTGFFNSRQSSEIKYVKPGSEHVDDNEFPEKVFLWATFPPPPEGIVANFVTWSLVYSGALTGSLKNLVCDHYNLGEYFDSGNL